MSEHKPYRILVIANESIDGSELRALLPDGSAVLVVAPALSSRLRFWVSDVDPARRRAERRLALSLPGLHGDGIQVETAIGDSQPLQAIADGLRLFPADEIVLVTHDEDEQHWVEQDLVERARKSFPGYPIVHLIAGARRLHVAA
jgi:hypothetical protein